MFPLKPIHIRALYLRALCHTNKKQKLQSVRVVHYYDSSSSGDGGLNGVILCAIMWRNDISELFNLIHVGVLRELECACACASFGHLALPCITFRTDSLFFSVIFASRTRRNDTNRKSRRKTTTAHNHINIKLHNRGFSFEFFDALIASRLDSSNEFLLVNDFFCAPLSLRLWFLMEPRLFAINFSAAVLLFS